jgi:hypothetical protein
MMFHRCADSDSAFREAMECAGALIGGFVLTQPATDLESWERGRQEALAGLIEALEVGELDLDADPLALLPHLNRLVADQDYDGLDQDDWLYLHSILAAFIADVLIRKHGARWRLRHDARGPNYMLVTCGYDGGEYEVSPMDVVYHGLQDLPPVVTRMLATAELTAHVTRRYDD